MLCTFEPITEPNEEGKRNWQCSREACGIVSGWTLDQADRITATCKVPDPQKPEGLGDKLARYLSYVGITQARMEIIGWTCNCAERQAIMNQVGWQLSDRLSRLFRRGG